MKTVIMAGGKGTRISSVASDIPKPMIKINEKPILEYELECLKKQGLTDIILVIGYLGSSIKNYFGDGKSFGVTIEYFEEQEPLGTAGALYYLKNRLKNDFLLLNGDIIFDIDFVRFVRYHKQKKGLATIFTHPNNHPYDSGLIVTDKNKQVIKWLHKEDEREDYINRVNAGIHILSPEVIKTIEKNKKTDLDRDILKPLIIQGKMFAYDSPEYVKDMGTPERYYMICDDIILGRVKAKNLSNKQKAVFLDRDGTINQYKGFITDKKEFMLIDDVAEAIAKANQIGYLVIVVTNQPVIARGECTFEEVEEINQKMERLLGEKGAYVDAIYYCPHHPDKGFDGEQIELKIKCNCRKPKPGMILEAAKEYNINLFESYMIGDDNRDVEAGKAAGCKTIYISQNNKSEVAADRIVKNLSEAIEYIINLPVVLEDL